jgi:hypothetical protein
MIPAHIRRMFPGMSAPGLRILDRKVVDVLAGDGKEAMRVFQIMGPHGCEAIIQVSVDAEVWCVPARQPDVTA